MQNSNLERSPRA